MQNFTLGKKGYSMLLFALVLLIGSSPTFAQCPIPVDEDPRVPEAPGNQQFYCALATVSELKISDFDGVAPSDVRWYDSATPSASEDAIPSNEILENDKVYYAGNSSKTCTSREGVTAKVTDVGPPVLAPGEDEFFTPCQRTAGNPDNNDIGTLKAGIEFNDVAGYRIEYYADEFVKNSTILTDNTKLVSGTSYFAGLVGNDPSDCQTSSRTAIRYEPIVVPAPTAEPVQTVCAGTTVGELEASGTNRWYRTATSEPPLPNSTVLEDGKVYYATQIIPSDGPPCESQERTPVGVIVQPTNNVDSTQEFCESIGEGNDFRMPQVRDLSPAGGTFFAEENSTTPLDPTTELAEGEDYFNRATGDDCSQDRITVNFFDTPNAGGTTQTTTCTNDDAFNLVSRIGDSQLGAPQDTGFFTPALSSGDNTFIPQDYAAGNYTFTYTVPGNTNCPTDTSVISVEVQQAPNAGPDQTIEFCQNEIESLIGLAINDPAAAEAIISQRITNADLNGNFETDDLQNIVIAYTQAVNSNTFPFTTQATYTVDNSNCSDSAIIGVLVKESPNAGDDSSVTLSTEQDPVNLFSYIQGNPDTGGTFSPENANGDLNPTDYTPGDYTFRYTVTSNGCSDFSDLTVTITNEIICPAIEDITQEFCESISDVDGNNPRRPQVRDLLPMNITWYATADSDDALSPNETLRDNEDYFAGNANGDCPNRERVNVQIGKAPNAGATTNITACTTEEPFDIVSRLNPSILGAAMSGGTVTPAFASGTTVFNPAVDPARQYRYTIKSEFGKCADDFTFVNITITEPVPVNPGNITGQPVCSSDDPIMLAGFLTGSGATPGGTFSGIGVNAEGTMFDPSVGPKDNGYTITYTVNEDDTDACVSGEDSSTFVLTVIQGPYAGDNTTREVNPNDPAFNLFDVLVADSSSMPDANGTFSSPNANGDFDPSTGNAGTYTYTVTNLNGCIDTADIIITFTNEVICPQIADTTQEFCESISDVDGNNPRRPQVRDLLPMNITWYATADSDTALSPNEILRDNVNYFAGNANGDCPNRERVNVQIGRAPNAGATTNITACTSDVSFDIVDRLNPSILGAAMSGGTVTPAFASGTTVFNPAVDAARQYRYTITSEFGKCDDDFTFVNINFTQATQAEVGVIANQETCVEGEVISLATLLNADTTSLGGTFSGTGVSNGIFDPALAGAGLFTITYNVNGDIISCTNGNASGTFTVNVTEEATTAIVGTIPNQETCVDGDAISLGTLLNVDTTSLNGTFTGTGVDNGIFNPAVAGAGLFTITYNVNGDNNPCIDGNASGTFTINVTEEATTAMVGTIPNQETCVDGDAISLGTLLNADTTSLNGTFTGTGVNNGIFNPAVAGAGLFTITYNVNGDNNPCIDGNASGTFTINVTEEATTAIVGTIPNQETCIDGDAISLGTLLNADTTSLNGTFTGTGVNNGIFNPAVAGAGLFTITYDVNGDNNPCINGNASGTFTINVTDPADSPTAEASQSFCLIDNPTVGDIVVVGDNIVIYSDADLTEVVDATTELVSGMIYYAVSTNDTGSCSSDATVISVTITDPSAPALSIEGNEFCRSDNPTVQDLINNFTGSGVLVYTSSTGGSAISATTPLQNGATYYGASVDGTTGCESSERLAVVAKVEFCGIPEGFSPNGDGKNDMFVIPEIAESFPNYSIEIFNRWGNVVFKGNASTGDWDGISNQSGTLGNDVLPVGVYFYILNYNDGQTSPVQGKLYLSI